MLQNLHQELEITGMHQHVIMLYRHRHKNRGRTLPSCCNNIILYYKFRLSLQSGDRNSERHLYENREQAMISGRHNSSDLSVPYNSPRRASFDDGVFMPARLESGNKVTPLQKIPNAEDDMMYQNIQPGRNVQPSRASPTKKSHLSPISVPVPEGYYTVTPPPLVRQHHPSNVSPSSSPEESIFQDQMAYLLSKNNSETTPDTSIYANASQELSMAINVGDNVIVNKPSRRSKALSPPSETPEIGGMYQNLEFMRGSGTEQGSKRFALPLLVLQC